MKENLVIVESPAKAKTIAKYLGKSYEVKASVGHIKDLPRKTLGVDVDNDFQPSFEVIKGKKKVIDEIKKLASGAKNVFLAPDPDREGEAIAWHVAEEVKRLKNPPKIFRVLFNEITKKAIQEAITKPTEIDTNMYEAQLARRILDRLVGYQISPLLWDKVRRGLSAGRVQSVAVRLVCEREAEIKEFNPEEYWSLEVDLEGSHAPVFKSRLAKIDGEKAQLRNEEQTMTLLATLKKSTFKLGNILRKEQKRNPTPPFITSKLQQEAARKLGFTAKKTMMLAQRLYEGVELESETVGLITYMRTDSTRTADSALEEVREYISAQYGPTFIPDQANQYKSKKGAQDAHEAIRPTSMIYTPEKIKNYVERDAFRLYDLIWKRFVASQMAPAIIDRTTFVIEAANCEFRTTGSIVKFPGFMSVYMEGMDEQINVSQQEDEGEGKVLPPLSEGEALKCHQWSPAQHFTQPPPRFTEASLVKELEEKGIGRPSTYASILSVIQEKKYVEKTEQKKFRPTDLGVLVNDLLVHNFPNIMDARFTARMENELDDVEEGKLKWNKSLADFYATFSKTLIAAKEQMRDVKRQEILTDIHCEKCNAPMVIKFGRHGEFLACQSYPECKNTKEFKRDDNGKIQILDAEETGEICDKCSKPMIIKRGRFGRFLACSGYPNCKNTKAISIGVDCPKCKKPLTEKKSKRGKVFYGCTGYPNCDFASWDRPIGEKCPECKSPYLIEKITKARGAEIKCPEKDCTYKKFSEANESPEA